MQAGVRVVVVMSNAGWGACGVGVEVEAWAPGCPWLRLGLGRWLVAAAGGGGGFV